MDAGAALRRLFAAPIAHRGLHACGAPGPVENSLSAARAAIAGGYGIECDVQLSRDGEAMVFHDEDLTRLTGRNAPLVSLDARALAALPLGKGPDTIPTLAAFLETIGDRAPVVVEIKSTGSGDMSLADRILALVAAHPGVVAIESFDPAVVRHCRDADPRRPIGLVGPVERGAAPDVTALAASDFLSWAVDELATVAGLDMPLSTWTVRTPAQQALAARAAAQIVFEGLRPPLGGAHGV